MNKSVSEHRLVLLSSIALAGAFAALMLLLLLAPAAQGGSARAALYPRTIKLTDTKIARWAGVMKRAVVRAKPGLAARIVTTLPTGTTDGTQNVVLVLARVDISPRQSWYKVRLPILPNNTIGYVQPRYLTQASRQDGLQDSRRHRQELLADPPRRVLHPQQAHELQQPVLRADRFRNERPQSHSDRLAGRRLRRRARNEPAADHPRAHLARLHPHAERGHPGAGAADARGHAADDSLRLGRASRSKPRFPV